MFFYVHQLNSNILYTCTSVGNRDLYLYSRFSQPRVENIENNQFDTYLTAKSPPDFDNPFPNTFSNTSITLSWFDKKNMSDMSWDTGHLIWRLS